MSAGLAPAAEAASFPIAGGAFVAVVGPSGAGKDSVIHFARRALAEEREVFFVRRVITRPSDPDAEDHDTLEEAEFAEAERTGTFAVAWGAHGLRYGLPIEVDGEIGAGAVAVANVSRNVVPTLAARYVNVIVAEIMARPEILAERLAARGRESRGEVLARLARSAPLDASIPSVVRIDNSGALSIAGGQFVALLRDAMAKTRARP